MFSDSDWEKLYSGTEYEIREFLADNSIEDIGSPPDWGEFYSYLVGDSPFKTHAGIWPSIFKNWYRLDIKESRGIGGIAAGMSSADDDIEFFTNNAVFQGLWDLDDFSKVVLNKICNIAKAKKHGRTPSVRFLESCSKSRYKWADNYAKNIGLPHIAAACNRLVCNQIPFDTSLRGLFKEWQHIDKSYMYLILNTASNLGSILSLYVRHKEEDSLSECEILLPLIKSLDGVHPYYFTLDDIDCIKEHLSYAGAKNKRIAASHILDSANANTDPSVLVKLMHILCSESDLRKMKHDFKFVILKSAYCALTDCDTDMALKLACERIFNVYGYNPCGSMILAEIDESLIDSSIRAHLDTASDTSPALNIEF